VRQQNALANPSHIRELDKEVQHRSKTESTDLNKKKKDSGERTTRPQIPLPPGERGAYLHLVGRNRAAEMGLKKEYSKKRRASQPGYSCKPTGRIL